MSDDIEESRNMGHLRSYKSRSLLKNKLGFLSSHKTIVHDGLDKNCLYSFSDSFLRIEYPAQVKNVDKAIETLGGIDEIEKSIDGKRLELKFNPFNYCSNGCVADKDSSVGFLLKVVEKESNGEISFEVLGPVNTNFKFSRLCDFQYLPLISKTEPENEESEVEYMFDKVINDKIPSLEWFTKKDESSSKPFLISAHFARFDTPQPKFEINSADSLISFLRPDVLRTDYQNKRGSKKNLVFSIRVSFADSYKIPDQPLAKAMEMINAKILQKQYSLVSRYFEERPIWRRSAIMHKTNISHDSAKFVLPCLGYYSTKGPWRNCWIRFGYDPFKNYNSRIYQVLDYRVRSAEGMQLIIKSRKTLLSKLFRENLNTTVTELDYSIKPNRIPPARQMFYQYCDILIPEVQEMLSKLPKLPPSARCDPNNGWLPLSFQDHCREIVSKYISEAVQMELMKASQKQTAEVSDEKVSSYCSRMLNNIKLGAKQSMGEFSGSHGGTRESIVDEVNLSDNDDELEVVDVNEIVNSLPERIPKNFDEDDDDDDESDLEIDMEAVEDVNKLVAEMKNTENKI